MQQIEYNVIEMENDFFEDLIKTLLGEENTTLYHVVKNFIENRFDVKKTLSTIELDKILPLVLSMTSNKNASYSESAFDKSITTTEQDVNELNKRLTLF
jgi:hypothetical protein